MEKAAAKTNAEPSNLLFVGLSLDNQLFSPSQ